MKKEMGVVDKNEIQASKVTTPAMLLNIAIDKGANLEKLEKLMDLQMKWDANEAKKAYVQAMAEFKANPPKIEKDKKVSYQTNSGTTSYKHATLAHVTEKINTELSKHGLSASWETKQNGSISVTCRITHILGHSEETTLIAQADKSGGKNDIQGIGSTVTYLQRYTIMALTGLAAEDQDDDGKGPIEYITEKEEAIIMEWVRSTNSNLSKFCKAMGVEALNRLPKEDFNKAITALKNKGKK